jgi:peptidoglycan/LPS O-acetylase OafA/YrhL
MYFGWIFCLLIGLAVPLFSEVQSKLLNTITKNIAKYSYGIYLSHGIAMTIAFSKFHTRAIQLTVLLLLTSAFSVGLYHVIEHPGIRAGKALAQRTCRLIFGTSDAPPQHHAAHAPAA